MRDTAANPFRFRLHAAPLGIIPFLPPPSFLVRGEKGWSVKGECRRTCASVSRRTLRDWSTEYIISTDCYSIAKSMDGVQGVVITESDSRRAISYRGIIPYGDITHRCQADIFVRRHARTRLCSTFPYLRAGRIVSTPLCAMGYSYTRNCRPGHSKPLTGSPISR